MGGPNISCRIADKRDAAVLVLFNQAIASETEGKSLDGSIARAGVERLLDRPQFGFYVVAQTEDGVVGSLMITYEWTDWRNGLFWWIQSVYVTPPFRRQGVYRSLYDFVRKMAQRDSDVRGLRLYAAGENRVAHEAYHNVGMKETSYRLFEQIFGES